MREKRTNEIINSLKGFGTKPEEMYTNKEIVDLLMDLQAALARGVFEKKHAEHLRDRDVMIHFESLAKEYGIDNTDTYLRFKNNMSELGYTIGTFIKGMNGEKIARRALKLLSYEKDIEVLYNIELEDEDTQAEYDAIVIAPYGLFVIEVKNWSSNVTISANGLLTRDDNADIIYDLPGRMSIKEALLRGCLGDIFPLNYNAMLLFSNENTKVTDLYNKISVSYGGGISYEIKSFCTTEHILTSEQVIQIRDKITASHKEQRALCTVKCDEIINDYAALMAQIEELSSMSTENKETRIHTNDLPNNTIHDKDDRHKCYTKVIQTAVGLTAIFAGVIGSAIAIKLFKR